MEGVEKQRSPHLHHVLDLCLADYQSQYVINIRLSSGLSHNHKGSL